MAEMTAEVEESLDGLRIPTEAGEITSDFLTQAISRLHPGTEVRSVEVLEALGVGGMVSTTGRAQLKLAYAEGAPRLPERVVSKMVIGERRALPSVIFETEVRMYRDLLAEVPIEKPECLAAVYEPDTGNFILMLEDLEVRGATFTNVLKPPMGPQQVGALLDTLATLHAHYWKSPRIHQPWLGTLVSGPCFRVWDDGYIVSVMQGNLDASPYRRDVLTRTGVASPEALWGLVKAVHRHNEATLPFTLCHGDTGAHNTYLLPDGTGGFLDWQLSAMSTWVHDVHYLIVTSLSVADRRLQERSLIERYLNKLQSLGVDYHPTLDEAFDAYTLAIMWGFSIGWFAVRPVHYGMEIISANIERLLAAATDHDIFRRAERLA
jgi:hypothetical protein